MLFRSEDAIYLIAFSENEFGVQNYALSQNITMNNVFVPNPDTRKFEIEDHEFFNNKYYNIFRYNKDDYMDKYKEVESLYTEGSDVDFLTCYEVLKGGILFENQLIYDSDFESVCISETPTEELYYTKLDESMYSSFKKIIENNEISFPILNKDIKNIAEIKCNKYPELEILEDINGFFIHNKQTNNRSNSYKDMYSIMPYMLEMMLLKF